MRFKALKSIVQQNLPYKYAESVLDVFLKTIGRIYPNNINKIQGG